jgi:hypothetical protein
MALSMDEQRMLDELEQKLAADDPLLASKLTTFGHPGLAALMRSSRARLIVSVTILATVAVIAMVVYAIGPFRTNLGRPTPARSGVSHTAAPQLPGAGPISTGPASAGSATVSQGS